MDKLCISRKFYKSPSNTNPALSNYFCADPLAIEYQGRLYVYGTNDNQQYEIQGDYGKNTYEKIKSLVCFSTDDMVNWTFHGLIDIEKIAPWALTSWAPAIIYRKEADGLTHFYLYFSNTGCGVGVLTATNPLGPWTSPLDHPLIVTGMKGIEEVPNPFDPGACIDDKGNAYLVFGGGIVQGHSEEMAGSVRIVKLGPDLISLDSDFVEIKAPYFFEASALNFINGTFVYTYNSNWQERKIWNYPVEKSSQCSMNYMTSKNPLDSDSWIYRGNYFKNPGDQGLNYSNNHTSLVKFNNQYYLFYHTLTLQEDTDTTGGFRSICVDKIEVDEESLEIKMCHGSRKGLAPIKNLNPFEKHSASTIHTSAEISFASKELGKEVAVCSENCGAWLSLKALDFAQGAKKIILEMDQNSKKEAFIEIRLDKVSAQPFMKVAVTSDLIICQELKEAIKGIHDLYFVFSKEGLVLKNWRFE
ncbi:MAG: family 43 glycosylhydrolase [Treponema sp.]|nr:family 43 glycosylhydrolase [Treponema sp.]